MELRVFWTDTARFQLEDIFNYYKDTASLKVARKLVKQIIERTIQLEKNPNSGSKEPLLSDRKFEYRYLVEGNYKIIVTSPTHRICVPGSSERQIIITACCN